MPNPAIKLNMYSRSASVAPSAGLNKPIDPALKMPNNTTDKTIQVVARSDNLTGLLMRIRFDMICYSGLPLALSGGTAMFRPADEARLLSNILLTPHLDPYVQILALELLNGINPHRRADGAGSHAGVIVVTLT